MTAPLEVECAVIGAGIVGLAVAQQLARVGGDVLVLERESSCGRGISSRNSGVIHGGLYYPRESLKTRLCLRGKELLYALCRQHRIAHRACGKLVVAGDANECAALDALYSQASANGVEGLTLLTRAQVATLEPRVRAHAALLSASTGIVDVHEVIKALEAELGAHGGLALYNSEVTAAAFQGDKWIVRVERPGGTETMVARWLINAAGLHADRIAALAGDSSYQLHWAKGDYFAVSPSAVGGISRLIYPLPSVGLSGLGVHLTADLGGRLRFGPDVSFLSGRREEYQVDEAKAASFLAAARRLLPDLGDGSLSPDFAGIRPKLAGPGEPARDFVVAISSAVPRLLNLVGIESPGVTAALAIAEYTLELLTAQGVASRRNQA